MLSKRQFLKKFISFASTNTLLYPSSNSFLLQKSIQPFQFLSYSKISSNYFSSLNNTYKDDLALLDGFSREQLAYSNEIMDRYSTSQDLETFHPKEIEWIITLLQHFANASQAQGDLHKAYSYIEEAEKILQKLNIDDVFLVAYNHFIKASICLNEPDSTADIEYHFDEVDRICKLLRRDPQARSLRVQNLFIRGDFYKRRNKQDKALELFNEVLEKKDQVVDGVLSDLLIATYDGIGRIYASRKEVDKAVEFWTKGLETAIPHCGENSSQVFFFYRDLADILYHNQRSQETLPYIEKGLQVALKIYPSNDLEIGLCHYLLGNVLYENGSPAQALKSYKKSIKINEIQPQKDFSSISDLYFRAAVINHGLENHQEASLFFSKSAQMFSKSNDPDIINICLVRADQLAEIRRFEENEFYLKIALDSCKNAKPQDKNTIADINFFLGILYFEQQDWKKALEFFKESEKLSQEASTDHSYVLVDSYLATLKAIFKDYEESVQYFQKAIESSQVNKDFGFLQQVYYYLGKVYHQSGMTEKENEAIEKSRNLCKTNNQEDPDIRDGVEQAQKVFSVIETLGEQKR